MATINVHFSIVFNIWVSTFLEKPLSFKKVSSAQKYETRYNVMIFQNEQ